MAPSHLQGLNIVYPEPQPSQPGAYLSDADLLAVPNYPPELARQLDLWTNLAFHNEPDFGDHASASGTHPNSPISGSHSSVAGKKRDHRTAVADEEDEEEDEFGRRRAGPATPEGHENVVTATPVTTAPLPPVPSASAGGNPQFDLATFLSSLGLPPVISAIPNQQQQQPAPSPSLATILSLYSQQQQGSASSSAAPTPSAAGTTAPPTSTNTTSASASTPTPGRGHKRARTSRKASDAAPPPTPVESSADAHNDDDDDEGEFNDSGAPLTAAEDKRRRNTAASARFRAKKKEREAALEKRAKDLEGRVVDLERECEALRRENGWLKGLVVGVTGAGAMPAGMPIPPSTLGGAPSAKPLWHDDRN